MARTTVYNTGLTEDIDKISPQNKELIKSALSYYKSLDRTATTLKNYKSQLEIFFCWNYRENGDKFFIDLRKRDFINFMGYARTELKSSSNRIASLKAVLSSFSNAIEVMYDMEYPNFRNLVRNLEVVVKTPVREKTILSEEQVEEYLAKLVELKKYQLACYLALLASSGCRKSEMVQMKTKFFDGKHEVFEGFMYKTDNIRSKGRGSAGKVIGRYVIKGTFKPYFDLWMKQREEKGIDSEYLFVTRSQNTWIPAKGSTMDSFAETLSSLFGIDFYNHCVRHYFCTKLKKNKLPDEVVVEILHWSSPDMVKIYNDTPQEEMLSQYLGKEGFKEVEPVSIKDIK